MMTYIDFTMLVHGVWLAQAMIWGINFFDELIFFLDVFLNFFLMTFNYFFDSSLLISALTLPRMFPRWGRELAEAKEKSLKSLKPLKSVKSLKPSSSEWTELLRFSQEPGKLKSLDVVSFWGPSAL